MTPDPLEFLWPIVECQAPTIGQWIMSQWPPGTLDAIRVLGLFREAGDVSRVICPECFDHEEEIVVVGSAGRRRMYISCPAERRVEISPAWRRQFTVDLETLASQLATAFSAKGRLIELLPQRVWQLGRTAKSEASRDLLFARGMHWSDAQSLRGPIMARKKPIVLAPSFIPAPEYWARKTPPVVALSQVATLRDGVLDIDRGDMAKFIRDSEHANDRGSQPVSRAELGAVLDQRIRAAKESSLTDDLIFQELGLCAGNAREATRRLNARGFKIHHSTVSRKLKALKSQVHREGGRSIVDLDMSQARDTGGKIRNCRK
jgi:hypothetical protein